MRICEYMSEIIYKELSYKLYGIFYELQNRLGRDLTEKQYAEAIEQLFKKYAIKYKREVEIPIKFEGLEIKGNRLDFFVENLIPIDIKVKKYITREDYRQMKRYLIAADRKLGLVINFREYPLKIKRIINSKAR